MKDLFEVPFETLFLASENNDVDACNELGLRYYYGKDAGVRKYKANQDFEKAFYYFDKAFKIQQKYDLQVSEVTCVYLAELYMLGKGVKKDIPQGVYLLDLVTNINNKVAYDLAMLYYFGLGVEPDYKEVNKYISRIYFNLFMSGDEYNSRLLSLVLGDLNYYGIGQKIDIKTALYNYAFGCMGLVDKMCYILSPKLDDDYGSKKSQSVIFKMRMAKENIRKFQSLINEFIENRTFRKGDEKKLSLASKKSVDEISHTPGSVITNEEVLKQMYYYSLLTDNENNVDLGLSFLPIYRKDIYTRLYCADKYLEKDPETNMHGAITYIANAMYYIAKRVIDELSLYLKENKLSKSEYCMIEDIAALFDSAYDKICECNHLLESK